MNKNGDNCCPLSCEGEDRTPDLRVMSPTSYRCSTSRCGAQRYGLRPYYPKEKRSEIRTLFFFFTLYVYDLRVTLLEPLVLISRINPSPLNLTLLAPLAFAFNSLFTVIFTEDAPDASAVQ